MLCVRFWLPNVVISRNHFCPIFFVKLKKEKIKNTFDLEFSVYKTLYLGKSNNTVASVEQQSQ